MFAIAFSMLHDTTPINERIFTTTNLTKDVLSIGMTQRWSVVDSMSAVRCGSPLVRTQPTTPGEHHRQFYP